MHLNKNHTLSRRALAMLLTLALCFSLVPSAFAAQQNSYHDPAEHWMQASNRTNELDVNSVVTRETFKCGECGKVTSFEVFRVPEYTRNGQTALSRNVKYSDGTMMDGVGKGDCMDGVPGKDAYYTGYHYTKAVCETCGGINTNEPKSDYGYLKNVYWLFDCAAEFTQKLEETVTYEYTDDTYHTVTTKGGTYCAFCYGTNHTVNSTLERHSMETEVLPQPANGRFATVEKCSLCDYASYDYTAAKAVIADYYGVVDGQPHTITVSDLSEAGVRTSIRYGNSAESCTMTSAPNYTEEGQYTVYYEITYTYRKGEDGQPEIMPEEAAIVRRIYRRYLDGCTLGKIKRELDEDGIPTAQGVECWSPAIIHNILTNEKYIGDALLLKTYVTDCISQKVRKNRGERVMYYVENNHPAIVSRETFDLVRKEMTRRSSKRKVLQKSGKTELGKYSGKYALTELLVCGECGSPYKRVT